jgi:DNA-binding NarL/FixJ family response regulator
VRLIDGVLLAQGRTHTQICAMLGLSPKTVRKFIHSSHPRRPYGR